jgi:hypothetical protein
MPRRSELDTMSSTDLENLLRQGDLRVTAERIGQARTREIGAEVTQEQRDAEERRQAALAQLFADLAAYPSPVPEIRAYAATARDALSEIARLMADHQQAIRTFRERARPAGAVQNESGAFTLGTRTLRRSNPMEIFERLIEDVRTAHHLGVTSVRNPSYHPEVDRQITTLDRTQ